MRVLGLRLLLGARHDQRDIGMGRIGDVALGAVEDPAIAIGIGLGGRLHGGTVAARARLGKAEAGDLAARDARPPFFLLRLRAAVLQRGIEHADIDREDRAIGRRGIGHRLHDLGILRHVEARPAVIFGNGEAEQPHLLHFLDDLVRNPVVLDDVLFRRQQPFADIAFELVVELFENVRVHTRIGGGGGIAHRVSPDVWLSGTGASAAGISPASSMDAASSSACVSCVVAGSTGRCSGGVPHPARAKVDAEAKANR